MVTTTTLERPAAINQAIVAAYKNHADAESAVRRLGAAGIALGKLSIIGKDFETVEDVEGYYRPSDAAVDGAGEGAWLGGLFGLTLGAFGFFVLPVVGGLVVMGPLAGLIAGAIGGAGVGALINGLVTAGVPEEQAIRYQERLQAGEFLVVVQGSLEALNQAHEVLSDKTHTCLMRHGVTTEGFTSEFLSGVLL